MSCTEDFLTDVETLLCVVDAIDRAKSCLGGDYNDMLATYREAMLCDMMADLIRLHVPERYADDPDDWFTPQSAIRAARPKAALPRVAFTAADVYALRGAAIRDAGLIARYRAACPPVAA